MSLIPDEVWKRQERINLAPMVDFLFLVIVALFCILIARSSLHTSKGIQLVAVDPRHGGTSQSAPVLGIDELGTYWWREQGLDLLMVDVQTIADELQKRRSSGLLPSDPAQAKVLVRIDRRARWESVASLFLAVKGAGFTPLPLYEAPALLSSVPSEDPPGERRPVEEIGPAQER